MPLVETAYLNKGVALSYLGEVEKAIETYNQLIGINPQNSDAWFNKGLELLKLNENSMAYTCFTKCIHINNRDTLAYQKRAESFEKILEFYKYFPMTYLTTLENL
jgi:tetratricopeptide (TPR) repeat protein